MTTESGYEDDMSTITMLTFKCVIKRVFDTTIDSRLATFKIEMSQHEEVDRKDFDMLMDKVRVWFSEVMNSSLMFNCSNLYGFNCIFSEGVQVSSNYPMVFPGEPTDEMIAMLVQAKLNAFASPVAITFGAVEMETFLPPDEQITSVYLGWAIDELPSMTDWIGERAYHDSPWWARNDGCTIDIMPTPDEEVLVAPEQGFDMSIIESRYSVNKGLVVSPDAFKPKIIDCKQDDKPKN